MTSESIDAKAEALAEEYADTLRQVSDTARLEAHGLYLTIGMDTTPSLIIATNDINSVVSTMSFGDWDDLADALTDADQLADVTAWARDVAGNDDAEVNGK